MTAVFRGKAACLRLAAYGLRFTPYGRYAAYAGGIIGFSSFGPQFVMGLGYFDQEYQVTP